MAWCPHCDHLYDEFNESQPCCGACGHPIECGCDGHADGPWDAPARSLIDLYPDLLGEDLADLGPEDDLPV